MLSRLRIATLCLSWLCSVTGAQARQQADTLTINSTMLGQPRRVFVSPPASHALTTRNYPVLIVLDGEYNFGNAATISKQLAALGHIPEAIVVGVANVSNNPRDRVYDMTPPGMSVSGSDRQQGGDKFLDFVEKELLPEIRTRYRGGAPNMLVGHSSGGVIVTYAAATRPDPFPVVVSIDAPTQLDASWLVKQMLQRARTQPSAPLRYVSLETRFGWSDPPRRCESCVNWLTGQHVNAAPPRDW